MEQKRLLLAFLLSAIILFGWSYFFPFVRPQQNNSDSSQQIIESTPTPENSPQIISQTPLNEGIAPSLDDIPRRALTISSPLYEVALDSRGAVATSWIIKRNKDNAGVGKPLYSIASTKDNLQPLQLISPHGLEQGNAPLRLVVGRDDLDSALSSRNFQIAGIEGEDSNPRLEIKSGEQKLVEFRLADPVTGLNVVKRLTFDADHYTVKLETKISQNNQPVPNAKITIGPSIGDQGVPRYTFYSVAPEAIAMVGDKPLRLSASDIDTNKDSPHKNAVNGPVQWAAIGDTYFAMVFVLSQPVAGLEYRTVKYPYPNESQKTEERYLITGYVPVSSDGSPMYLYTGPKDHDQLQKTNEEISGYLSGRQIDLEGLINYGWLKAVTRPLAAPILWSIKLLNTVTGSYGLAIILFTIVIYTLFFPLKWRSSKSMKKAQKLAPRMKELQEKIKGMKQNDPRLKDLQMEQLRLMKEGNPLGGCLPLLIQMPFLIALYSAITISIDFRQSSFLWMPDLSAADPYRLLPILMAGSMVVLQLITPAPSADPLQRKMMAVVMPAMMLYIMWSAPAGLLVYWLVGNLVGFGQQVLINRLVKSEDDKEQQPPEKTGAGTRSKKNLNEARVSQA
ncbi:MAG: membrane protein insertase YidC [Acidobacteria bacterium]|nr:membrane protein insertase YidC [Acidobacteriota bacterium]